MPGVPSKRLCDAQAVRRARASRGPRAAHVPRKPKRATASRRSPADSRPCFGCARDVRKKHARARVPSKISSVAPLTNLVTACMGSARSRLHSCDECAICLEPLADQHEIVRTSCNHLFHLNCAARALQRSDACALCRSTVQPLQWAFPREHYEREVRLRQRRRLPPG